MTEELRPPPYPDSTLANGWRFELDLERIKRSDTWSSVPAIVRPWLLLLWSTAWSQEPCGTLPDDPELIASKLDMPPELFAQYGAKLMRGWWKADNGRLYHDTITVRVLAMLEKRAKDAKRAADKRARDAEKKPTRKRITKASRVTHANDTGDPPVSSTPSTKHQAVNTESAGALSARAPEPDFADTKAGAIGRAFKAGGVDPLTLNLADPRLQALIEQGAQPAEFQGLAAEAVRKGIDNPFPWVLKTLPARRAEAAALQLAQPAPASVPSNDTRGQDWLAEQEERRRTVDQQRQARNGAAPRWRAAGGGGT